mmetsp:Transcript_7899/g.18325  ORF Transcript_7899/g.18325 Transcript_7899/m.18325 type:complete len:604 (+) Transcript_7899:94-1905(+)
MESVWCSKHPFAILVCLVVALVASEATLGPRSFSQADAAGDFNNQEQSEDEEEGVRLAAKHQSQALARTWLTPQEAAFCEARQVNVDATCHSRSFLQKRSEVAVASVSSRASTISFHGVVDVVIVGAGYSGLTLAQELHRYTNVSFRILEARHRVGGRILDADVNKRGNADDRIEIGGQWLHDTHVSAVELMKELGFDLYQPGQQTGLQNYSCGGQCPGRVMTGTGWLNSSSMHGLASFSSMEEMRVFQRSLGAVEKDISETSCDDPLSNRNAKLFDSLSYDAYLREHHKLDAFPGIRAILADICLEPESAKHVSALHCLWKASCNGGRQAGHTTSRVRGGPQAPLQQLASQLNHSIRLMSEVQAIIQHDESREQLNIVMTNTSETVLARHVVLAGLPPAQISAIKFEPQLPAQVSQLLQRLSFGSIHKYSLVYKTPWWRARGYSGEIRYVNYSVSSDPQRCWDNSPYSVSHGVLTCMTTGDVNRNLQKLSKEALLAALLSIVHEAFGNPPDESESPEVVEKDWSKDVHSGGANMFYPPGAFSSSWPSMLSMFFNHRLDSSTWIAGADYSHASHGYMNGAIASGQAVAKLLVKELHKAKTPQP